MRKFMKGCAITALLLILLGLILGVSGSLGNGSTHVSPGEILSAVTLGRISGEEVDDWSNGVTEQIRENMGDVHYDLEDNVDYDSDYEVRSGKIELYVLGDDSQSITDLQVQAGGCVMKIQVSEDNCFRVEADGMRKFQGYVEGGTMEIRGTSKVSSNSEGNLGGSICLYVPEGYYFENTSLDLGAGSLSVEELQTGALEVNVGAGKMTFEKLEADQAELDCGAGQMTVGELSSRVAEVSVGMGSVRLNGDVTERLDGECSMGELKLTLAGTQTDFNYDLSCGMGELKVGDDSYNGLAQEKQINNNASKNMELECAMGSVVVEFK